MLDGIRNVLLDLGGVLYGVNYHKSQAAFAALTAAAGLPAVHYSQADQAQLFDLFETGHITANHFRNGLREKLGDLSVSDAVIDDAWNAMLLGPLPARTFVLQHISKHYPLAMLSNTNAIHWSRVGTEIEHLLPFFLRIFTSHEMGLRKPEAASFLYVLNAMGWQASETLFVDDSHQHIVGAAAIGLRAFHLTDPQQLDVLFGISHNPS